MTAMQSAETFEAQIDMSVATRVSSGFAQVGDVADYLRVSRRNVTALMSGKSLFPNRAGRFAWEDIWWKLWRVRNVPVESFGPMTRPVLTNADVADILGVHERSIRRDGDRDESRYELPAHLNLSERIRRHHPLRIQHWSRGLAVPSWLEPIPAGQGLALVGRKSPASEGPTQVSDRPTDIGQYDKHPTS